MIDYDARPMRAHTRFTYPEWREFLQAQPNQTMAVYGVILAAVVVPQAIWLIHYHFCETKIPLLGWLSLICIAVAVFFAYHMLRTARRRYPEEAYREGTMHMQNGARFTFFAHSMVVQIEQDGYRSETALLYNRLYRVTETANLFCLFTNPGNAFVLSKHSFESGTADELRRLLQAHTKPESWRAVD